MKSVTASKYRIDRRTMVKKSNLQFSSLDRRMPAFRKDSSYLASRFHWKRKALVSEKRNTMSMAPRKASVTCQTRGSRKFLFSKFKMRTRVSDEAKVRKLVRSASNRSSEFVKKVSMRVKTSQHFYRSAVVRAKYHLVNRKKSYCINYIRSGACNNLKTCQLVHDFVTIRICLRFLNNRCTNETCGLSHSADPNRMPICSFFESGVCSRGPSCPFLHIKHRAGTPVCADFMWSFCPRGAKCYKRHVFGSSSYVRPLTPVQPPSQTKEEKKGVAGLSDSFLPLLDSDSESDSDMDS